MQRVYLLPQLLNAIQAKEYEDACLDCKQFANRLIHLAETEENPLTLEPTTVGT